MRATKINVASCHAVLSTLVDSGYLARCADQRTYTLGRALVALGQAALRGQPLITRAQEGAQELQRELGTAVLLTTVVGEEILAVLSLPDAAGRAPGMRAGERMPLVAPIGAPFLAWSSAAEIKAWIARHTGPRGKEAAAVWHRAVLLTRKRGYQVTLRAPNSPEIATLMAEMASGGRVPDHKDEVLRLVNSFGRELSQPETLEPDELYDLLLISAPLFDQNGAAAFNLSLFGFSKKVSGSTIVSYADRLVRSCLDIMRADREQPLRRGRQATGTEFVAGQ
jgi:DNA-binding IclR family transcriptional regulator